MSKEPDETDKILDKHFTEDTLSDPGDYYGSLVSDYLRKSKSKAKQAILTLIANRERKARIDTISDMIIECYDHDNPMDIAKELEQERAALQAEDKK